VSEPEYLLAIHSGVSTLHKAPGFKECRLEEASAKMGVDVSTGAHLVDKGQAVFCEYCFATIAAVEGA